jgi:hypothetical protein
MLPLCQLLHLLLPPLPHLRDLRQALLQLCALLLLTPWA